MIDVATLTPEKRAEIKEKLEEFYQRQIVIDEAAKPFRDALKPFRELEAALEGERELYLEAAGVEVVGTCEHGDCGILLVTGDIGSRPYSDETQIVCCAEHSMSYGDIKHHWEKEDPPGSFNDDPEARADALKLVADHLAAGGSLDEKYTWVL